MVSFQVMLLPHLGGRGGLESIQTGTSPDVPDALLAISVIQAGIPPSPASCAAAMTASPRHSAWPSGQVCSVDTAALPDRTVEMSQPATSGST